VVDAGNFHATVVSIGVAVFGAALAGERSFSAAKEAFGPPEDVAPKRRIERGIVDVAD
jgi:hypothetical protein